MVKYRFQIEQLKEVLNELGSPHLKIPVISVAGTNGKGSVSGLIQGILTGLGKKTGLYTSPHIFKFTERIIIDNKPIPLFRLKAILREIRLAERKTGCSLTKFELLTALAIKYFFEEDCDFSVMEAGLGGRLDATNVCENKIVSVITPVSIEHVQYLGKTLRKIALEKAGIIKPRATLVDASGVEDVRRTGKDKNCRVYTLGIEYNIKEVRPVKEGKYAFTYVNKKLKIKDVLPALNGRHQLFNTATAITAVSALGFNDPSGIKHGIKDVKIPGRMEIFKLPYNKRLVVDAAHNPSGMNVVRDFIQEWKPVSSKLYLIMGVYEDKDCELMSRIIEPLIEKVWTFTPEDNRALDAGKLAGFFKQTGKPVRNYETAYKEALTEMKENDWLLACGSFSVVRPALMKQIADVRYQIPDIR